MDEKKREEFIHRINLIPIGVMSAVWLSPMFLFWAQAFGPLKNKQLTALSPESTAPSLWWFLFCFGISFLAAYLPAEYWKPRRFEADGRVYKGLGVVYFKRIVPNGDLINRWIRKQYPNHRVLSDRKAMRGYLAQCLSGEKGHLVLLLMGCFTALYAWRIGWYNWAIYLTLANIATNLYPIWLQRYNRVRIYKVVGMLKQ